MEAAIDRLIAYLDTLDMPTMDMEPDDDCCDVADDDPSPHPCRQAHRDDGPGTPEDAEPSLGWETGGRQTVVALSAGYDAASLDLEGGA